MSEVRLMRKIKNNVFTSTAYVTSWNFVMVPELFGVFGGVKYQGACMLYCNTAEWFWWDITHLSGPLRKVKSSGQLESKFETINFCNKWRKRGKKITWSGMQTRSYGMRPRRDRDFGLSVRDETETSPQFPETEMLRK